MHDSLKPTVGYGSVLLTAACLMASGCSRRRDSDLPPPLPPLPAVREQQGDFLLTEATKSLNQLSEAMTLSAWRRISWIHQQKGDVAAALTTLDRALKVLNDAEMSTNQETAERSSLADQYLLLGNVERARQALGDFRYQGTSPKGQSLLKRAALTPLEETRLQSNDVFQSVPLILMLRDQGLGKALWAVLQSRIEFAIMRGPTGARQEHFHSALLLLFHLSKPQDAITACLRQPDAGQIRTFSCLLWGGTQRPSMMLYQGDSSVTLAPPTALRPVLRAHLIEALRRIPDTVLTDSETSAGACLAALQGDFALAECFAQRLQDPVYRRATLVALTQRQVPLFSYQLKGGNSFEHHSIISRNLGQLVGIQNPTYQQRLLEQFIGEMRDDEDSRLFAPVISLFLWKYKRYDLLAKLETVHTSPAFLIHQALLRVENALDSGKRTEARVALNSIADGLGRIPKLSHRFQEGLLAQELARRLGDRPLMEKLRQLLMTMLPDITIATLKNDGRIRLAGLNYLCGQITTYRQFVEQLKSETQVAQHEAFWTVDLLGRLAQEQTRLGEYAAALECVGRIPSRFSQISGMLMIAEAIFKTPPLPAFPVTPSLQAGPARGLRVGP